MTAPALVAFGQGQGAVSADNLNTFVQSCDAFAQLRGLTGVPGLQVFARGQTAVGDGLARSFYWDQNSTATDDNLTVLQPTGGAYAGRWIALLNAGGGAGGVTAVSVVSANGFAGTVATPNTTPAITLTTSITGLLKGNATAISAATAATDYVAPGAYASTNGLTMSTARLLGRSTAATGPAEEITVGSGLSLTAGTLTATGSGSGTVTSVAALTLGTTGTDLSSTVANSTTTPVITLNVPTASATNRGALSAADWSAFNAKGSGTVTSVAGDGTVNGLTLTGTVTTSGSLTLGGALDLSSPPAIGGTAAAAGTFTTVTANASTSASSTTGAFRYGTLGYSDTNHILTLQASQNSYIQAEIQNTNAGATASADIVVANNSATATTFYGNFGMNSSGFTGTGAFSAPSTVYLTATSGDLALGTTTANAIHFVVNNGATDAATISSAGLLTANSFASSSAALTGGSINGVAIGGSTASTGAFTSLTATPAANTTGLTITQSLTGSGAVPALSITPTWNTTGTAYGLVVDVTNTASNASSAPFDVRIGGSSKFKVGADGTLKMGAGPVLTASSYNILSGNSNGLMFGTSSGNYNVLMYGGGNFGNFTVSSGMTIAWSNNLQPVNGADDLIMRRAGAANLALGSADAATAVAQTFSVQGVVAGTTNTAGAARTFSGSVGTGTGAGGDHIFSVALPGSTGSAQNALVNAVGLSGTTGAFGYVTGVGGTVTQATSRTTGVTLNKPTGQITLVSAAGLATYQSFTLTNSAIGANDVVVFNQKSGTDLYIIMVTNVAAGSCKVSFATTGGVTVEQPVFSFAVIRGASA